MTDRGFRRVTVLTIGVALTTAVLAPASPVSATDLSAPTARGSSDRSTPPTGWRVTPTPDGVRLSWRSLRPVPVRDAAVEFRLGSALLGVPRPRPDGRTFVLTTAAPLPGPVEDLAVVAGGLPLDRAGRAELPSAATSGRAATPPPSAPGPGTRTAQPATDPGVTGPYATTRTSYQLPGLVVTGLPVPVEVLGEVVSPVGAPGARPLVLFLHGRHSTCYKDARRPRDSGDWPCPSGWLPVPSHLGYLDAQQLLASQGYVTVSISANGINGQDWQLADGGAEARSELVRHHLALWDRWATRGGRPFGRAFVGQVELDDVLLVGHSRGGEGVNRAAADASPYDPWHIAGQVLIGPTAFGRQTAPGVDTVVLLPFCDGDVSDLQGQQYVDQARDLFPTRSPDPALRSAVMVMGANHNYFNQEWTPGESAAPSWDDWWDARDPLCGSKSDARLTPEEERNVGAVYVATAAAAFVGHDAAALTMIDGSRARPASLGRAVTHVTSLGARRAPLYRPSSSGPAPWTRAATAAVCRGYRAGLRLPLCARSVPEWSQPHFLRMYGAESAPPPLAVSAAWTRAGGAIGLQLPRPVDVGDATSVELRVSALPTSRPVRFGVTLVGADGTTLDLGARTVRPLPGGSDLSRVWARTVRLPLPSGVDTSLGKVRALRLRPLSAGGSLVLLDAQTRQAGPGEGTAPALPRVDVMSGSVLEGDGGDRVEHMRVEITGQVRGGEQVWVQPPDPDWTGRVPGYLVTLVPGQRVIEVPFTVHADDRDDYDLDLTTVVKAVHGVVTGDYVGTVRVVDDDPTPRITAVQRSVSTVEGGRLVWVLRLSAPSDKWVPVLLAAVAPVRGDELAVADLTERFLRRHGLPTDDSQTPLSESDLSLWAEFEPGVTQARVALPTQLDDLVEPTEHTDLVGSDDGDLETVLHQRLTGSVTDVPAPRTRSSA